MTAPSRLYRLLLHLYPARFREEYAGPLARLFEEERREARGWARAVFYVHALADLATSIPAQIAREFRDDALYAVRVYRKRPLVSALAMAALAVGIGATTGAFSVVNALLLRGLPFRAPEQLVLDMRVIPSLEGRGKASAEARWRDCGYLESGAIFRTSEMNFDSRAGSDWVTVAETTSGFFNVLGARLELGRAFASDDDVPGRTALAVIGYGIWRQRFGGDPRALGATIRLNGMPLTVIGIAPPGFDFPNQASVWTPTFFDDRRLPKEYRSLSYTLARLKPGITPAQANERYYADLRRAFPNSVGDSDRRRLTPLRDSLAGPVRTASLALLGMTALVLLIACANVAQLLLSRVAQRRQELTLRAALGASRARLAQQLITESLLITAGAAAAGLVVAHWAARLAASAAPPRISAQDYAVLDSHVLWFAITLAVATGILFGVVPACLAGRMQPAADFMRARDGASGRGVRRMRAMLIGLQTALALTLVAGSATLGHGFLKLEGTDLGVRTENAVTASVSLLGSRYEADHEKMRYYEEALARLRALPGVESVGAADDIPLEIRSRPLPRFDLESGRGLMALYVLCTPEYFRSVGADMVAGRKFTDADREGAAPVVIVNEAFARQAGGISLIGRKLNPWFVPPRPVTVVGVVRNMRTSPTAEIAPQVFAPAAQETPSAMIFVARVQGEPERRLALIRDALRGVDPQVPAYRVETLEQMRGRHLAKPRFYAAAVLFFGCFALLLAVIGVYGVAAHAIAQRRHEIGVRIAVGAAPSEVRGLILRQSLVPVAFGMAAGIAAALGAGRFVKHLIASAEPVSALICAACGLLLAASAATAVWSATRRITRVDPVEALRTE
jgi:putative ABC transport system permease protein